MAEENEARPIIIKRKKKVGGDGHHGGAWKVAYADFVTAMMAFFMLMWLLNATTEKQRKGIADYFSPTIAMNQTSGGGENIFEGESLIAANQMPQTGVGAMIPVPTAEGEGNALSGEDQSEDDADQTSPAQNDGFLPELEHRLVGAGGESMVSQQLMRHVVTRQTDEGLIIELHDLPNAPLFDGEEPLPVMAQLAEELAVAFDLVRNQIAIGGHVAARPVVAQGADGWELTASRADRARRLLTDAGVAPTRIARVTGFADRKPAVQERLAPRNNRLEIILLRERF